MKWYWYKLLDNRQLIVIVIVHSTITSMAAASFLKRPVFIISKKDNDIGVLSPTMITHKLTQYSYLLYT